MRPRNTLILALLFVTLASYLYLIELPRPTEQSDRQPLLSFDKAAVTHIELEHPGRRVVLKHIDGRWQMLEPVAVNADERVVENLIEAVDETTTSRALEDPEDLATYALDVPSAVLRMRNDEGEELTLKLGKKTPVGNSAYAMRDSESSVFLTDAILVDRLDLTADQLRDKTVLAFEVEDVDWVRLRSARGTIALERRESGWRITAPAEYDADPTNVGSLLSTLQSMRATEFVDDAAARLEHFGLAEIQEEVVLGFADGRELGLRIGNERDGKLRVQSSTTATVFGVAAWLRDSLVRDVNYFRDKTIARFVVDNAALLQIEDEGKPPLEIRRGDGGWLVGDDRGVDTVVDDMVRELANLSGFEIAADPADDLAAFGLDPPHRHLTVKSADDTVLATVAVGAYQTDGAHTEYTAVVPGSRTVFHLRKFEYDNLVTPRRRLIAPRAESEGAAAPIPNGESGDDIDENSLDDAATAGE